jgi:predicted nucleic acid-binding protein
MSWLLDTNVLLRLADTQCPEHTVAKASIEHVIAGEESVFISTQVLVEFWAVATRPESANGLGWSTATTAGLVKAHRQAKPPAPPTQNQHITGDSGAGIQPDLT